MVTVNALGEVLDECVELATDATRMGEPGELVEVVADAVQLAHDVEVGRGGDGGKLAVEENVSYVDRERQARVLGASANGRVIVLSEPGFASEAS